jgi:hypothetical protein
LHPDCFARLAAANHLAAPDERLELPHFFLADNVDDTDDDSRTPPHLSADELRTINDLLAHEATRRKAAAAGFLRVLVDGMQLAEIDAQQDAVAHFVVPEEADVIEVYSADQQGALLMATHLLNLQGPAQQNFFITLEGGQRISFAVNLLRDAEGSTTGAQVAVAVEETAPGRASSLAAHRLWTSTIAATRNLVSSSGWWKPVAAFAVLMLLFAGAWVLWSTRKSQQEFVRIAPTSGPGVPAPVPAIPAPSQPQGTQPQRTPETPIKKAPQSKNEVAPPVLAQREPMSRQREETLVQRSLVPNSSTAEPAEAGTRGAWNNNSMGKPLNGVHQVYIQSGADRAVSGALLSELQARLAGSSSVRFSDAERADAALKISVRRASSRADDARVIVLVRAVNANGYVVWPVARRGSSWRYLGRPGDVAERIVRDLTRDIAGAKDR